MDYKYSIQFLSRCMWAESARIEAHLSNNFPGFHHLLILKFFVAQHHLLFLLIAKIIVFVSLDYQFH